MDFAQFDSRASSAAGRKMHVRHPVTGEPIFADDAKKKPCYVLVLGAEAENVQAKMRELLREQVKDQKKDGENTGRVASDFHKEIVKQALPLIAGFENVNRGDKPATVDDAEWFLNLQTVNGREEEQSFAQQVTTFATTRANYLGNGSTS